MAARKTASAGPTAKDKALMTVSATVEVAVLEERASHTHEDSLGEYTSRHVGDSGRIHNALHVCAGKDGHMHIFEEDGEGYIYMYPDQLAHLKIIILAMEGART